jgi:hypothetical protein
MCTVLHKLSTNGIAASIFTGISVLSLSHTYTEPSYLPVTALQRVPCCPIIIKFSFINTFLVRDTSVEGHENLYSSWLH